MAEKSKDEVGSKLIDRLDELGKAACGEGGPRDPYINKSDADADYFWMLHQAYPMLRAVALAAERVRDKSVPGRTDQGDNALCARLDDFLPLVMALGDLSAGADDETD